MPKKLLLLGGSAQQVIAIKTAKRLGCETILCDYLPDNPGRCEADRFYLISTTDEQAVLEVARREQVDGVLAYASLTRRLPQRHMWPRNLACRGIRINRW